MDLREGVEVDVVRSGGHFTRVMRYRVTECHDTGTLRLVPVTEYEVVEGAVSRLAPGIRTPEAPETPAPSRTDTPRRRLRLWPPASSRNRCIST